jgi:hypothetical protein
MTLATVIAAPSFDDVRQYVRQILCGYNALDPEQTPLAQSVIRRSGRPCGLFFHVQGPRLLRSFAIWAGEENRILFYDSAGARFGETRLSEAPDPQALAA